MDFRLDVDAVCQTRGPLLFANPNAPTGLALSAGELEHIAASSPDRLVVVDEAYAGFGAPSAAPLIARFDNVLVSRTLSKTHGLAGMRVGYALGSADLIHGLERIRDAFNSYPLDAVAQRVAAAAIRDSEWFRNASRW